MDELSALERNKQYDRQTVEVMRRVLARTSTAVDVGAHNGTFLRQMLILAPEGHHFAFEPLPDFARSLRKEFPGVTIAECALSDARGVSTFEHVVNEPGYSGLRRRHYDTPDPVIEQITVSVERLDDLIPADVRVDFIKIDVEGGEYHAMRGGLETIQRSRPVIVFEGAAESTGAYGVGPDQLYALVADQCGMTLSTMARWLERRDPYSAAEFRFNWENGPDFYFIASP